MSCWQRSTNLKHLAIVVLAFPVTVFSQASNGEEVFGKNCTFCHGPGGAGGSAPALAQRGLEASYIDQVINYGLPNTAMPGWGQRLTTPDLYAVRAFVKRLNGISAPSGGNVARALPAEAEPGRNLFFDLDREFKSCSTCHSINGKGVAVAPEIKTVPSDVVGLRNLAASRVRTAQVDRETFPAVVATQLQGETRLYDLTGVPPVLRTFPSSVAKLSAGGWQHSSAIQAYSDQELERILNFLRAAVP